MIESLKKYRYILYLVMLFVMPLGLKWIYKKYVLHHFLEQNKTTEVPAAHHSLHIDNSGRLYYASGGGKWFEEPYEPFIEPSVMDGKPYGTDKGIAFDFKNRNFAGRLLYGLCSSYSDYSHQAEVVNGRVEIDILSVFSGGTSGWQQTGRLCISYRLQGADGRLLFQGKLNVGGFGPFKPLATLASGPLLQAVSSDSAVMVFSTNLPCKPMVAISGRNYESAVDSIHHKFVFKELQADTPYEISITLENFTEVFTFRTFPEVGDRQAFTFAFTANTFGYQGGERNVSGVNMQGIQRAMALAAGNQARFVLFGGNLISGKLPHTGETRQQFHAWKNACSTGRQLMPVFTVMGENESSVRKIKANDSLLVFCRFPYDTESGEALFGNAFANPSNGPAFSTPDDIAGGAQLAFPPYTGNAYHFRCANTAFIVLNTHYWLNHDVGYVPVIGGNIGGFILDEQLSWFQSVLAQYESNAAIQHVIVVMHSPLFPLSTDCGWYGGDNQIRPWIGGKPHNSGLIERRDEILGLLCNQSTKVRAVLSGKEANFSRLKLSDNIPRYSEHCKVKHLNLNREIWQINSGSCGNPTNPLKQLPWRSFVSRFETMPTLCLFHVHGNGIRLEVLNPETLQRIEEVILN